MTKLKTWIVTTDGSRPVGAVAGDLKAAGLRTAQVLEAVGCVTGTASSAVAAQLRKVPGVSEVSPDTAVNLGPGDQETTW
jgi:hypothetical protein